MSYYKQPKDVFVQLNDDDIPILHYTNTESDIMTDVPQKKYENNTFIDWYVETMNVPHSYSLVYKKWITIIVTAIVAGYTVLVINLTSVWVNDLRKGLCFSKLNKWSLLNPYSTCPTDDWYDWSEILFDSNKFLTSALINFPIYVLLGSVTAFLAVYVSMKNQYVQQSGIPEVKEIIQGFQYDITGYLGLQTLFLKIIGLVLVVSSGFWLGKEGPLVHVSCCIINILYNMIMGQNQTNEAVRRELFSAATATGISLAFNSPIGGVLFVLELIPSYFIATKIMWNSFISATVGLVVLMGFKMFTEGEDFKENELFSVEFGNVSWLILEIVPFIGLGVLGGVYGHLFIKIYSKLHSGNLRNDIRNKLCTVFKVSQSKGHYVEILAIFFITCLLNFPVTITRLPLEAFLKSLFTNCNPDVTSNSENFMCGSSDIVTLMKLAYIGIQAFMISSYTFGTILPGGVLMPSLVIGAVCGRFVGISSRAIQDLLFGNLDTCTNNSCLVSPSSYAVIGAGAFMTGITKLTMCVVVILFELTGAVSYVLPIMISVMVSKFVSDYLCNENIYDAWLKFSFNTVHSQENFTASFNEEKGNGLCNYSTSTATVRNKLPEIPVSRVMVPVSRAKCLFLVPNEPYTYTSLLRSMDDDCHEGYPLLASSGNPLSLGYIHKQKLTTALNNSDGIQPNSIISFQVANVPSEVLSQQMRYEREVPDILRIELDPEQPFIIMNDRTSFTLIIDVFEKMYLNYLIIQDSTNQNHSNTMSGFIDRFIIAKIIDQEFSTLTDELDTNDYSEFDIDAEEFNPDDSLLSPRQRHSIELIT